MSGPIRSALMTAKGIKLNHAPSEAQKAAGNYKKHHVRMHGLDIALENVKGGKRSGVGRDGRRWAVTMPAHYGYIKRTEGADGDHVDVYIGPDHASKNVYVIDQKDAETGKFDEHKVMLGFGSEAQARATYLKGFSDGKGAQRIHSIKPMTIDQFKEWLKGDTKKPAGRVAKADGGSLRLYHGTEHSEPINQLDPFISPDQLGVHLGDAATANRFAKRTTYDPKTNATRAPRVIPFDVRMKNPLRLHDNWGTWEPSIVHKQLMDRGLVPVDHDYNDALMAMENGEHPGGKPAKNEREERQLQRAAMDEIHNMIRSLGHDGVVYLNRYEMPTDEAKERLENGPLMRGQLNKMTDEEFKQHFPEAVDSYISFDPSQLKSPFGEGSGAGFAEGGEVDDGGFDVYHSSPHDFDQFDMSRMGTGEGNQMYGHGLYFAEAPEVSGQGGKYWQQFWNKMKVGPEQSAASALFYSKFDRDKAIENLKKQANYHLSESSKNYGNGPEEAEGHKALHKDYLAAADLINSGKIVGPKTYEVRIKAPEERFLDWDAPISEQHEGVLKAIAPFFPAGVPDKNQYGAPLKGGDIYHQVLQRAGGVMHGPVLDKAGIPGQLPGGTKERLSKYLLNMGVPGIKYLDAGSRMRGAGTKNYVVFDDKLTHVKRKYAEGGDVEGNNLDQFFGPTDQGLRRRYYTGTSKDKDFTAFQESRHGTWLTDDPESASQYALQNDSQDLKLVPGTWNYEKVNTASRVIPAYVRIENPYTGSKPEWVLKQNNYKKAQSDWFDILRHQGYDAWVPESENGSLVVKLKNQGTHIKSAIGNSGAYDLTKKHLAKAEGGTVDEQEDEASAARLGDGSQAGGLPLSGGVRGGEGVLPASLPAHGEVDLPGLPTNIKIPKLGMTVVAGHNPLIRKVAREYARTAGIDYNPPSFYKKVDPDLATRIAHAYENMEHNPSHPLVKASYEALKRETLAQYQAAKAAGLKMEFYPDPTKDPYQSQPRLMSEDVNKNHHMYVYPTDAGFGTGQQPEEHENNPLLGDSGERWNGKPVMFNDLFRAVHDYYGHVKEGFGFRGDGEENAWRSHAAMYSPLARIALGSETRGQNSLLNYGPNGERNRNASTDDTFFSPQKLGVLPIWAHHEGAEFIRPEEQAQMEEIYKKFGVEPEGVVGASVRNAMSVFPKPQRMFPEDARPPGGQYLAMPDKRDVTGHKAAAATIGVQPGGKPFFKASADAVDQTGSTGRGTATAKTNLFKQKAGWKWADAPAGHENTDTIVSVEHRGKHHYALNAHFPRGVDLARYENSPTEPRLRPTTTGNVELGPQAGSILVRGKEHPVYRHVIVKKTGGLVASQYENSEKLVKKALMAAKKAGSRS